MQPTDKSGWGNGPWQSEPDFLEYFDNVTGYACMIARADGGGHLCGYVGVPKGHKLYGVSAFDDNFRQLEIEAHGSVNFSRQDSERDLWWFGFDCGHAWDFGPSLSASLRSIAPDLFDSMQLGLVKKPDRYRTIEYVQTQVTHLAHQLKDHES